MFWSGNYIGVRELNVLLKEGNVTLTQVLEAYDILQECKADNKALIQFLTKPEILAELITLVTEEPPKNVELTSQYRHANIASEVLASNVFTLRDRLSMDVVQMNRLCDFVNRDPPLNPLLASYFSKTIEILLQRSPKQDWYMHNIVCLRVLDFFKSRRDFLPNLLRHISTSAICDTFKCFLSLTDPFNEIVMEWLDEYQFLDSLVQIICGTYDDDRHDKLDSNHNTESGDGADGADGERRARARARAGGAANAAALLADVALDADAGGPSARALCARLRGADAGRRLLQAAFTAPPSARRAALVHACRLLLALLRPRESADEADAELEVLERAIAPHLPLLHNALLAGGGGGGGGSGVGAERVQAAALLARLAQSEVDDVPTALITLGTAGVLIDMLFAYPHNNFLHAQVCALIRNARENRRFAERYSKHLMEECDLLTRLMDAFEENEEPKAGHVRAGYMGHVVGALRALQARPPVLPAALQRRWDAFCRARLLPLLQRLDMPLGGVYPADDAYEVGADQPEDTTEGYQIYLQLVSAAQRAQAQARADGGAGGAGGGGAGGGGAGGELQSDGFLDLEDDDKK
ncbi:serine/threonine-protein phosphatase 6 regulatory subunit 3-B [Vanessa tameamea]|uniref:Serine/threonine-protein phosphatase 6 regulatory subunit 3-B n=1 Tax=Vanessa tameamea TaxID=334116 RepID=A0ABM4AM69_VANTA